jgi:hypothetical protein
MKFAVRLMGVFSLASIAAAPGLAQSTASSTTSATTTIYQPISIANNSLLAFGQIVKPANAGTNTVIVSAAGVRSLSGGGTAALGAGTVTAAAYTAIGEGGQSFSISAPGFTLSSGGNSLSVTPLLSAATGSLSGSFGAAGTGTFTVGGSFPLSDTTASGAYSGSLVVTVDYN